jgi:hypothetical protein
MPMSEKVITEPEDANWFRKSLHSLGRKIDFRLSTHQVFDEDADRLKLAALTVAKTGTMLKVKGEDILDKVTVGQKVGPVAKFLGGKSYDYIPEANEKSRAALVEAFSHHESFDAEKMMRGEPQSDQFRRDAAFEIDAMDFIAEGISRLWDYLGHAETNFNTKVEIFRDFENHEIGMFYPWQKVEVADPFNKEEPVAEADTADHAEPA